MKPLTPLPEASSHRHSALSVCWDSNTEASLAAGLSQKQDHALFQEVKSGSNIPTGS